LLLRLLADALHQADLGPRMRRQGPAPSNRACRAGTRTRATQVVAARRWLAGELDDQVAFPIGYVCDMLGLDAGVLAAAVRARATSACAPSGTVAWRRSIRRPGTRRYTAVPSNYRHTSRASRPAISSCYPCAPAWYGRVRVASAPTPLPRVGRAGHRGIGVPTTRRRLLTRRFPSHRAGDPIS
jgi:hypothetical protein